MPLNATSSVAKLPWFTTNGQIAQLGVAIVGCVFAGIKAWPEMKTNQFLSLGAVLFYILVAFVLTTFWVLVTAIRKSANHSLTRAQDTLGESAALDVSPALFAPATHQNEDFPVTRKQPTYDEKPGINYPSKVYVEINKQYRRMR